MNSRMKNAVDLSVVADNQDRIAIHSERATVGKKRGGKVFTIVAVLALIVVAIVAAIWVMKYVRVYEGSFDKKIEAMQEKVNTYIPASDYTNFRTTIENQIVAVNEQISPLRGQIERIDGQVDAGTTRITLLEELVTKREERLKAIEARITALEHKSSVKQKIAQRLPPKTAFPFEVDGVGIWNGKPFLSIGYRGKFVMVERGQRVNGWELVELDPSKSTAVFKNLSGSIHKISI